MRASTNTSFPQTVVKHTRYDSPRCDTPAYDKQRRTNIEHVKSWMASQRSSALRGKGKTRHPAVMWSLHTDVTPRCSCCENCRATRVAHKNCT